jgi:hypothetical protein
LLTSDDEPEIFDTKTDDTSATATSAALGDVKSESASVVAVTEIVLSPVAVSTTTQTPAPAPAPSVTKPKPKAMATIGVHHLDFIRLIFSYLRIYGRRKGVKLVFTKAEQLPKLTNGIFHFHFTKTYFWFVIAALAAISYRVALVADC